MLGGPAGGLERLEWPTAGTNRAARALAGVLPVPWTTAGRPVDVRSSSLMRMSVSLGCVAVDGRCRLRLRPPARGLAPDVGAALRQNTNVSVKSETDAGEEVDDLGRVTNSDAFGEKTPRRRRPTLRRGCGGVFEAVVDLEAEAVGVGADGAESARVASSSSTKTPSRLSAIPRRPSFQSLAADVFVQSFSITSFRVFTRSSWSTRRTCRERNACAAWPATMAHIGLLDLVAVRPRRK